MKGSAPRASMPVTGVLTFVAVALILLMLSIAVWALGQVFSG
jgi:hypothetical protein